MSKRLQVILEDKEFGDIKATARRNGTTVAEWVRQALRTAKDRERSRNANEKLAALDHAAQHSFPTAEIDEMLNEIERGYGG